MNIETDLSVRNVYANQMSIFKPFEVGLGEEFFEYVVEQAEKFYEFKGVSPIIQQDKFEGFMVDYFFLIKCLSRFMGKKIKNSDISEKVALNILRDFAEDESVRIKNGKLFMSILDNLNYVIMNKNRNYLYAQLFYKCRETNVNLIFCSIILNYKAYVENGDGFVHRLKKIADKKKYKYLGAGTVYFNKFVQDSIKNKETIFSFQE